MPSSDPDPPPFAAKNRTTATLRSSCDACAASKIRCTKEKPECVRCAKRGLTCSYSIPRRPGRPSQNRLREQQRQREAAAMASAVVSTAADSPASARPSTATTTDSHGLDAASSLSHIDALTPPSSHGSPAGGHTSPSFLPAHVPSTTCEQMVTAMLSPETGPWSPQPMIGSDELDPPYHMSGFDAGYDAADIGAHLFWNMGGVEHHDATAGQFDLGFPPLDVDRYIPTPAQSSPSLSSHESRSGLADPSYSSISSYADMHPLDMPFSYSCQQRSLGLMGQL